ncbi:MAG TPA: hypothetical protein VNX23_27235 [Bradyrhizobium sp.]|jgi:hypothetical protein|uniref:hypothetical protein n=1 Tax=Bradyrhizobium sp. TaxID=376 RepID=UPI002C510E2C|nr:hypothetical protein [Bradyrhizobium sp.]HXB81054.1 hypothetical protein [Bradyrhizobium sp.]
MTRKAANTFERMRVLPLRLRLAHLTALIRREGCGSARAEALAVRLRDQLAALAEDENRAV